MRRCKNCLLPEPVPGSDFDAAGVCKFCREFDPTKVKPINPDQEKHGQDFEKTMANLRGKGNYDVLVCLSGGKDSLYLLYLMKVIYKKRVLAFTTDINIPDVAWISIRKAIETLQLDHLVYRPPIEFYKKLFGYLLKNQEARGAVYTVSYVYAPLFEGDAIRTAYEMQIPVVVAGYSPGQPEAHRMTYEFSRKLICETSWVPPHLENNPNFSSDELARFWNPMKAPKTGWDFPRYLAPFHAIDYDQSKIMDKVFELGLVKKKMHASPIVSNYPINWLLMYSDLMHFNYNPYAPEFSALMRHGKASVAYWKIMGPLVDLMIRGKIGLGSEVRRSMEWLDLKASDLKVNLPEGAYDPKF